MSSISKEVYPDRLLRVGQVLEIIPICEAAWWLGVKSGKYPRPIKLGGRTTCWRLSDVMKIVKGEG